MWQPVFVYTSGFLLLLLSYIFKRYRLSIFWIIVVALIPRVLYLLLFPDIKSFDTLALASNADLTLKGINIYPDHARLHYPYFPVFLYLEAFSGFLTRFQISIMFTIKSIIILFDLGVIYLLRLFDKQRQTNNALLYALAPIPILVTAFHGQFDSIPIFFILLSLLLFQKEKENLSLLYIGTAIALKTWPAIFVYSLFRKLKNKKNVFYLAFIPLGSITVYMLFFKTNPLDIVLPILSYSGVQQPLWGVSFAIYQLFEDIDPTLLNTLQQVFLLMFFAFILFSSKKEPLEKSFLNILLFFFSFTVHSGIQWFLWIIPFLFLVHPKNWVILYFLFSAFVITHYASWVEETIYPPNQLFFLNIRIVTTWISWILLLSSSIIKQILFPSK